MKGRKVYLWVQAALCLLLAALLAAGIISIYLEGIANRAEHPLDPIFTPENVADAFSRVAPLFFVTLGFAAAGLVLGVKEEKAKGPMRDGTAARAAAQKEGPGKKGRLQIALLLLAAALIVAGALNGSMRDVLIKAINICTECIGLG